VQSSDKLVSFHESKIVSEKTALVQVQVPRVKDLSGCGGGAFMLTLRREFRRPRFQAELEQLT
jgi:hypothetical protein